MYLTIFDLEISLNPPLVFLLLSMQNVRSWNLHDAGHTIVYFISVFQVHSEVHWTDLTTHTSEFFSGDIFNTSEKLAW